MAKARSSVLVYLYETQHRAKTRFQIREVGEVNFCRVHCPKKGRSSLQSVFGSRAEVKINSHYVRAASFT